MAASDVAFSTHYHTAFSPVDRNAFFIDFWWTRRSTDITP